MTDSRRVPSTAEPRFSHDTAQVAVGDRIAVTGRWSLDERGSIETTRVEGEVRAVDEHGIALRSDARTLHGLPWWGVIQIEDLDADDEPTRGNAYA